MILDIKVAPLGAIVKLIQLVILKRESNNSTISVHYSLMSS